MNDNLDTLGLKELAPTATREFIRRFTLHILPKRFVKIRRYRIYNHTTRRNLSLQFVTEEKPGIDTLTKREHPVETSLQKFVRLTGIDPCICPACKTGRMVIVRILPQCIAKGCGVLSVVEI